MHPSATRLYRAAEEFKNVIGQSAVARLLNESPQTVKNWESRGVSRSGALKAQEVIGIGAVWILSGETSGMPPAPVGPGTVNRTSSKEFLTVPLLANSGSMGSGVDVAEEDIVVGLLSLSPSWINSRVKPLTAPENLRFIHGYGDSMEPTFFDGDVLLVDAGIKEARIDGVYVLEANSRLYIKRVRQTLGGQFEVSSDNAKVKTIDVLDGRNTVMVLGRVVWLWNGRKI